jgi:hypothetical protein
MRMRIRGSRRVWWEFVLAAVSGVLAVVTASWPDWIEIVTRLNPDGRNGSLEWMVVAGFACFGVVMALVACVELRRLPPPRVV